MPSSQATWLAQARQEAAALKSGPAANTRARRLSSTPATSESRIPWANRSRRSTIVPRASVQPDATHPVGAQARSPEPKSLQKQRACARATAPLTHKGGAPQKSQLQQPARRKSKGGRPSLPIHLVHDTTPTAAESPLPDRELSAESFDGADTEPDAKRSGAIAPSQTDTEDGYQMDISGSPLVEDATLSRDDLAVVLGNQHACRTQNMTAGTPVFSAPPGRRLAARNGSLGSNPTPVMATSPPRSTRRLTLGSRKSACYTPASNVSSEKTPNLLSPPRYARPAWRRKCPRDARVFAL